jgi:hypothetical protein
MMISYLIYLSVSFSRVVSAVFRQPEICNSFHPCSASAAH